jgi:DNA polymerase III alpha subunit (gram-positive type)
MLTNIIPTYNKKNPVGILELLENNLNLENKTLIFLDLETMGLGSRFSYEQIIEIGAWSVNSNDREKIQELSIKVKLSNDTKSFISNENSLEQTDWIKRQKQKGSRILSPSEILEFTHYNENNNSFRTEKNALIELTEFIGQYNDVIIVGHNVGFDVKYLKNRCEFNNIECGEFDIIDTLKLSKLYFIPLIKTLKDDRDACVYFDKLADGNKSRVYLSSKLGDLANAFDIKSKNWHSAIADVEMLYYIFYRMVDFLQIHKNINIQKYQITKRKTSASRIVSAS